MSKAFAIFAAGASLLGCDDSWGEIKCNPGERFSEETADCEKLNCPAGQIVDPTFPHECTNGDGGLPDASVDAGCVDDSCAADCDDGEVPSGWYADVDGDGLGDPSSATTACSQPDGYVANADDPYPTCARSYSAECTSDALQCGDAAGAREQCVESDGCSEWQPTEACNEAAPRCVGGACGACTENSDCERFGKICEAGACVQCTVATETDQCPGSSSSMEGPACDPEALTCTGEIRHSLATCGKPVRLGDARIVRCVSDSECSAGHACVPTTFKGAAYGNYCLLIAQNGACSSPDRGVGWPRAVDATSVGNLEAEFCFPRELLTTCDAVHDFGTTCETDADCGRDDVADGHCEGAEGGKRCTYACNGDSDCNGATCTGFPSGQFCNPF